MYFWVARLFLEWMVRFVADFNGKPKGSHCQFGVALILRQASPFGCHFVVSFFCEQDL